MPDTAPRPPTIDAQVHAYERDHPGRPWHGVLPGPPEVTGSDLIAAMDRVGVDGALLISPWSMYRYDPSYALDVHAAYPDRLALIKPFDPDDPGVEAELEAWAARPGVVGARIMMDAVAEPSAAHPGIRRILAVAARLGLPVNVMCWERITLFGALARGHPDTRLVLDHLGIRQPFHPPPPPDPFDTLPEVLALAALDNVAIKISGACTLSRHPFPFEDIWAPLRRIIDAFGIERCLWGTDWTRAVHLVSYRDAVQAFRESETLGESERAALMGENLARIYGWSPGARGGDDAGERG